MIDTVRASDIEPFFIVIILKSGYSSIFEDLAGS